MRGCEKKKRRDSLGGVGGPAAIQMSAGEERKEVVKE